MSISRVGIEFNHKGDQVIYVWPWRHRPKGMRFISLGFSGNGEFGDAWYRSLKELDTEWDGYFSACEKIEENEK